MTPSSCRKIYCVLLRGGEKAYLSDSETEYLVSPALNDEEVIEVGEKIFFRSHILYIHPVGEDGDAAVQETMSLQKGIALVY